MFPSAYDRYKIVTCVDTVLEPAGGGVQGVVLISIPKYIAQKKANLAAEIEEETVRLQERYSNCEIFPNICSQLLIANVS